MKLINHNDHYDVYDDDDGDVDNDEVMIMKLIKS